MNRRSEYKNYMLPGIYHITVKAAEALRAPFGKVVGNIDKKDGDPDAPRVTLSPVGKMVEQELLHSITAYYPMIEVQDYVIMPEHMHFIVVVKRKIVNRQEREAHLGQVIAGFKLGCNHRWWKMTGQQLMRPTEEECQQAEPAGTGAGRLRRQGPHHIATLPSLFDKGYCDVMPIDAAQLEQQRAYIKGNPRSRLMRTSNREWLQPQRGGINTALTLPALRGYLQRECPPSQATAEAFAQLESRLILRRNASRRNPLEQGETSRRNPQEQEKAGRQNLLEGKVLIDCDTYGDRNLLSRPCLPVVCHRKYAGRLEKQKQRCLDAAKQGVVLVSARIAPGEQTIMDEAASHGYALVLIVDNGFPEVYHPSTERIERCAEDKLLIVSPWEYHYRRKDEDITVMECKTMNCIAQALCRKSDDWWK